MDANLVAQVTASSECFNPRARDGREQEAHQAYVIAKVSIHAPVMDANCIIVFVDLHHAFQSTRP